MGITPPELDMLDTFEDVEYERRNANIKLAVSSMCLFFNMLILFSDFASEAKSFATN